MNAQQEEAVSILRGLVETCRDGQEGFRTAAECVADDPELKMLLSSFSLQRAKDAGELESLAIGMGDTHPERAESTFAAKAHRGWIHLKTAVTRGDNHAILAECERGEDVAVEAYNEALSHDLPDRVREVIARQREEVKATHNTIKALRDATAGPGEGLSAHEAIRAKAGQAAAGATEVWRQMKHKGEEVREQTQRYLRRNPLPVFFGVLLLGFGIGLLMHLAEQRGERQRRKEARRLMRRTGIATAAWLGIIGRKARKGYAASVKTVRRRMDELEPGARVSRMRRRLRRALGTR